LYKDGDFYFTIDSYVPNSGSYRWRIPTDISESTSYQIKIKSSSYSEVYGHNIGNFTISQTLVQKVTTPIIILVIFILVLVIATKVILKYRMKKNAITDEKGINQQQYNQTFTQFNKNEVTPEEYENIWEKGNL
jgi:uncharacterized membrane protein